MDTIQHITVHSIPCGFTFAQLLLNQGDSLVQLDTPAPKQIQVQHAKDFAMEELLQVSLLEAAARANTADIEKRLFVAESVPQRQSEEKRIHAKNAVILPKLAPCLELRLGQSTVLNHCLTNKYRRLPLNEGPLGRSQLEERIFAVDETPVLFQLQVTVPQGASSAGMEQLREWARQQCCMDALCFDAFSTEEEIAVTGSVPALFKKVETVQREDDGVSELFQRYSDGNMKLGAPLTLKELLDKMSRDSGFAQYAGLSLVALKQEIQAQAQHSASSVSKAVALHCIRSLQQLISVQADSALVESYLTDFLNKTCDVLQDAERTKIEGLLERVGKTRYIVINEDRLCDKDKVLFNLVETLTDNRVGVVERNLGHVSIVFDLRTAAIISPGVLSKDWIETVVDYLGRHAVQRFELVYIFVPLVPENFYLARLLGMLTARLCIHVHVTVRMTTNLPQTILSITKQTKWFGRLDWDMASRGLDTFELNTKAEDVQTLRSERFLSHFPSINAVLARCVIALSGTLGVFLSQEGEQVMKDLGSLVSPVQVGHILKVLDFDVNPARTKALRKRKLGLTAAPNTKNPKQLTLSWKS